ncbi:SpvB/TcaC N-terminal domain-containing protein [Comamonas endophytica]|uniref:SpvB/TcaC N-terminal domain-containing protein n=1 Tax=Comamonas endophytica TaxID=2949090 RepID=UPI00361E15DC
MPSLFSSFCGSLVFVRSAAQCAVKLASLAFLVVHAQTTVPVKLAGDFSVSSSGAAVYRIPIQLPPGIAGTQPKLALLYNSQAGNGIMGMGWSVEGLSAITRCAKSMATDGTPGAITHSQEDRFCMDGQRLINIAGGYGAADSEYRTEIDGFSKIVAKGAAERNASNGPQVFIVKTKDGLTLEYGSTDDSRIEVRDGHVVRMWALSNVIDVKGNWTNYAYSKDHVNGEFNISSISYGGDRKVIFEYESRPDILNAFEAGSKIRQSVRLARIKTYLADKEQQSLAVTYSEESSGFASLPKAIKRCSSQECTFDTSLEWTSAGSPNFSGQMWSGHSGGQANNALGDFNGDGITDMIGDTGGGGIWHVCLSTTSGFNCESWSSHQGGRDNNVFGDFNGDGLTDMMAHTGEGGSWHVCLSTGSGFSCSYWSGHGEARTTMSLVTSMETAATIWQVIPQREGAGMSACPLEVTSAARTGMGMPKVEPKLCLAISTETDSPTWRGARLEWNRAGLLVDGSGLQLFSMGGRWRYATLLRRLQWRRPYRLHP